MKKNILIVEDDPDLVYILQRLMGLLGHDTIAAKSGKEAVKIALVGRICEGGLNHSGLDSPQLAAFVIPAEAGIQFFMSGFPPTRE